MKSRKMIYSADVAGMKTLSVYEENSKKGNAKMDLK